MQCAGLYMLSMLYEQILWSKSYDFAGGIKVNFMRNLQLILWPTPAVSKAKVSPSLVCDAL